MDNILLTLTIIFLLATLVVLIIGIVGMLKGTEFNKKHGNKLMQLRVAFQALTIICVMLLLYTRGGA